MIDNLKKEKIAIEVIRTLYGRYETFPEEGSNVRNDPFTDKFLNAFSEKLNGKVESIHFLQNMHSWLQGLSTSLGQSFFENVARILSDGRKREYTANSENLLQVSRHQKQRIDSIITSLENRETIPDIARENSLIFIHHETDQDSGVENANGFTADVFIEKDTNIDAIELKSVRPNKGEVKGEKRKILEAKAALYHKFEDKQINYYFGFPFDPTSSSSTGYNKRNFLKYLIDADKYLDEDEILVAEELWYFLSGEGGTMDQILEIIDSIATPDFKSNYDFLNNYVNRTENRSIYRNLLQHWFLFRELDLFDNEHLISFSSALLPSRKIKGCKNLFDLYKQPILLGTGREIKYNETRYEHIRSILEDTELDYILKLKTKEVKKFLEIDS